MIQRNQEHEFGEHSLPTGRNVAWMSGGPECFDLMTYGDTEAKAVLALAAYLCNDGLQQEDIALQEDSLKLVCLAADAYFARKEGRDWQAAQVEEAIAIIERKEIAEQLGKLWPDLSKTEDEDND